MGDEKLGDEKLGDEKLGDEKLGDEKLGDEKLGSARASRSEEDAVLFHRRPSLGDWQKLKELLHDVTGIAPGALEGRPLSEYSVADRMAWAGKRNATQPKQKIRRTLSSASSTCTCRSSTGRERRRLSDG
jgi:hypothetical protein